jgi:FkbM family methyltransferase
MSTNYFILTKFKNTNTYNDENNKVMVFDSKNIYILPQINLEYYMNNGLFEKYLIDWCLQYCSKDTIFLDIGAHTGTYALSLASSCKHVFAFEPQRLTFYALCGSVVLSNYDNITCIQKGLGSLEQVGNKTLKIISNDGGGSSLHATSNILSEETIEMITLDSLNISDIGFIKIDVEENELYVLKGAKETIKRSGYPKIIFESNSENPTLFNYLITEFDYNIISIKGSTNMYLATR